MDKNKLLLLGVSCGLSATYVAAQLSRAMDDPSGRGSHSSTFQLNLSRF